MPENPDTPVCRRCGEPLVGRYDTHLVAAAEQRAAIAPDGQGQGHAVLAATSACSWACLAVLAAQLAGPDADAAVQMVAERERQTTAEGYQPEHDDRHPVGVLALAGAAYVVHRFSGAHDTHQAPALRAVYPDRLAADVEWSWPWDTADWKPRDLQRDLVRAGALLAAEVDRARREAEPRGW